jgi:hypothetical protein
MRAASIAIAYEFPKLAVTAVSSTGSKFAALLDQRLQRANKIINAKPDEGCVAIEKKVEPPKAEEGRVTDLTLPPLVPDRRFRRRA